MEEAVKKDVQRRLLILAVSARRILPPTKINKEIIRHIEDRALNCTPKSNKEEH